MLRNNFMSLCAYNNENSIVVHGKT